MEEEMVLTRKEFERLHDSSLRIGCISTLMAALESADITQKEMYDCAVVVKSLLEYINQEVDATLCEIAVRYETVCATTT